MGISWNTELLTGTLAALIAIPITLTFSDPIAALLARVTGGLLTTPNGQSFAGTWEAHYWRSDGDKGDEAERQSETLDLRQIGAIVVGHRLKERHIRLSG